MLLRETLQKGTPSYRGETRAISPTPSLRALENGASSMEVLSKWLKTTCRQFPFSCMKTRLLEDFHDWPGKKRLCRHSLIMVSWSRSPLKVDVENPSGERMQNDREQLQQRVTKNTVNCSIASLGRALKAPRALLKRCLSFKRIMLWFFKSTNRQFS